jgi:eukaryotic-like serine/threonine-protein kinase
MSFQVGNILFDKYRIEELIGCGSFAEVYRATHIGLNASRALKIIYREKPGVSDAFFNEIKNRFMLEVGLGAEIDHPNVIRVYDVEIVTDHLILVMEYAPGGSLSDKLDKYQEDGKNFTIDETRKIALEITSGLSDLHNKGVVHRDLKPSNIIFDEKGNAKVADFGLAQVIGGPSLRSQLSHPKTHPGTPGYMSPEQAQSQNYLTPASDVYALGLLLFRILTGRSFASVKPETKLKDLRKESPRWLNNLVARMLADDPHSRPLNGDEVAQLMLKGINQDKQRKKSIWISVVILGVGVVLLSLIVIWLGKLNNSPRILDDPTIENVIIIETKEALDEPMDTPSPSPTTTVTTELVQPPTPSKTPTLHPSNTNTLAPTHSSTPTIGIGSIFQSPSDGMTLIYIPAGEFEMGSESGATNERPTHNIFLDAFWIDRTEVTNALFLNCIEAGICKDTTFLNLRNPAYAEHPVVWISRSQASSYCSWVGRRLPTEAEWEKAARGTDGRTYPWGEGLSCQRANYRDCVGDTTPVGSYQIGSSPWGVMDMAGNVWEWVADWYDENYYNYSPSENPSGPSNGSYYIVRGGSWRYYYNWDVRTTIRLEIGKSWVENWNNIGFRCALDAN